VNQNAAAVDAKIWELKYRLESKVQVWDSLF
jgi:hypothetical protein